MKNSKILNHIHSAWVYLLTIISLLMTSPAWADLSAIRSAAERSEDKSRQALIAVFGDVVNDPFSSGSGSIIASIFQVTNSSLLVIGGFLALYVFFKKVTQTAHDGTVFHQAQHTVWGPLRLLIGFVALVPTASGWSLAQLVMLWFASIMGVGIANLGTDAALSAFDSGSSMVVQPTSPDTKELARKVYEMNLCRYAINAGITEMANAGALMPDQGAMTIQLVGSSANYQLKSVSYSCGGAYVPEPSTASSISNFFNSINTDALKTAHQQALANMQNTLSVSASNFVNAAINREQGNGGTMPDPKSDIANAAQAYETQITTSIPSTVGDLEQLSDTVKSSVENGGWWMLGAWYQTFAQGNTKVNDAVNAVAKTYPQSAEGAPGSTDTYQRIIDAYLAQSSISTHTNPLGSIESKTDGMSAITSVFDGQYLIRGATLLTEGSNGQTNPLIAMKNMGDYTLGMTQAAIGVYIVTKGVIAGANKSAPGFLLNLTTGIGEAAKASFEAATPFILAIIFTLTILGGTLAVYLPMIPFVIWCGAVINWLIVVGEAVIAAPLWAMTHLTSEGEGMGSRSAHGYIFLLNVAVRPILIVIGFFLGGAALIVGGTFVNEIFSIAVANVQFDSVTGIVSTIFFLIVYISLCLNLVHSCFNLILIVPDQVINWIGGHAAPNIGRDENQKTQQAVAAFGSKIDRLGSDLKRQSPTDQNSKVDQNGVQGR